MNIYEPTPYMQDSHHNRKTWKCKGLQAIVDRATEKGYTIAVDELDDDFEPMVVNRNNVVLAVNELEEAKLLLYKDGKYKGWLLVIPSNDEDWLVDYTVNIQDIVEGEA